MHRLLGERAVLADGAMGTMLLERGVPPDACLVELNLRRPEMVAAVHSEYLLAGAEIIETNTFGANAIRLEQHGLRASVAEINRAGAQIARECVAARGALVAGAIGPPGARRVAAEARAVFAEQIVALAEGGVDLLMAETMMSMAEAAEAIHAAREVAPELPLVVMMTVDAVGRCLDGELVETAAARLSELGADLIGCNCSDGPESVLHAIERMRRVTGLPLAAMPNAGLPRKSNGRWVYAVSPEEMAGFARRAVEVGATLVGGCCGTTPEHTRAMRVAMS
ncbi:MAG TPA: homocysteine S-methyltransferase family protein [Acidobacteriaceae bacterium]